MHAAVIVAAFVGILGKEIDETNDISIPPPPINLDSNLRKALLRALTELENEDNDKENDENEELSKTIYFSTTARVNSDSDKIVEKASASAVTIYANSEVRTSSEEDTTNKSKDEQTEEPIVIVQKSPGVEQKPIISVINNLQESNNEEQFIASASSSFTDDKNFDKEGLQTRSVSTPINFNSVSVNDKTITAGIKSVSITPKTEATSPLPTTTTEESQAKVEDVQFFSAPLVAAFTVHQDERGLPKKVEAIYKSLGLTGLTNNQLVEQEKSKTNDFRSNNGFTRQPIDYTTQQHELNKQKSDFNAHISQQNDFSKQADFSRQEELKLEEYRKQVAYKQKQTALEEQIYKLEQQQKNQQDYLLRQQQSFQNQFESQRLLNEKVRLAQNDAPFMPIVSPVQSFNNGQFNKVNQLNTNQLNENQFNNNQINNGNQFSSKFNLHNSLNQNQFTGSQFNNVNTNFNNGNRFKGNTVVSFQPSLTLTPEQLSAHTLPLNAQILPIRNAVDFRQSPITQTATFQQYSSLTPPVQNSQNNFGSFQTFPNNFIQSLPPVQQSNRVFRQEPVTGNFATNEFSRNNFNQFQTQQQPSRFFRSNAEGFQHHPQNVNNHLNNLLYNSGITRNVRQNDDLSIVSKILSYNVGRDNLFLGSRINEQRLPVQ